MTEKLTREQIEAWRDAAPGLETAKLKPWFLEALCTLALSALDAQKRIEELEEALRKIADPKNYRPDGCWADYLCEPHEIAARALNTPKESEESP